MTFRVFLPQLTIDEWVALDRVDLQGQYIALRPGGIRLALTSAAFFKSAAGASGDLHGLVGKVKDQSAIDALGGEAYMSSVVVGESAYDVEPGFLATADETVVSPTALYAAIGALGG